MFRLLFISLVSASLAVPRLSEQLPFLVMRTKLGRSSRLPSHERIRAFHEAQLAILDVPHFFLDADRARVAMVDAIVEVQCLYNHYFKAVQRKSKVDIKRLVRDLLPKVESFAGIVEKVRLAHEAFDMTPSFRVIFSEMDSILSSFIACVKDLQGQTRVEIEASGRLVLQTEQQMHVLRSSLSGLADLWLGWHVSQLNGEALATTLRRLWGIAMRIYLLFTEVGLAISSARLAGDPGIGEATCVCLAARARLSSMTGDAVVKHAEYMTNEPELLEKIWGDYKPMVAEANSLFREATHLAQRGDINGSNQVSRKHRESVIASFKLLRQLSKF